MFIYSPHVLNYFMSVRSQKSCQPAIQVNIMVHPTLSKIIYKARYLHECKP